MILIKDNVKRELTDAETIKMFLEAGWVEHKVVKPVEKPIEKIEKPKKDEDK